MERHKCKGNVQERGERKINRERRLGGGEERGRDITGERRKEESGEREEIEK